MEMLIRGGRIHDAVHPEAYAADILVRDGKIAAIGANLTANHAGNFHAKMAEHQRCQQHARRAQLHAANFDSADQIADRRNDKDCQKTAHWLILLC